MIKIITRNPFCGAKIMDIKQIKIHKLINLFQMVVLFSAMAALLATIGWVIAGIAGVKFALIVACLSCAFSHSLPSQFVMRFYRARPVFPRQVPVLYQISNMLAQRADLKRSPTLYLMPGRSMNAFATGSERDPAICLGQGLIHTLNPKEIAGILGHEISHIKNHDIMVMGYAALFNRIIYYVSLACQIGLLFVMPIVWMNEQNLSIIPVMLIALAPVISLLLNQALSRSREYEADLGSALLTGNPDYLTSALTKLEIYKKNMRKWFGILIPSDQPNSLLSTHPQTKERIRRLQSYKIEYPHAQWAQ